ncbi:uncharacterized protein LOC110441333 [Mizuhopecten yessoensis]|uniref:uncharacterized protein LOC110441333 n=1 Tax=Mizuhopecten yessoensis TaxID=6573 RepID=UPI000B45B043|nr:uncharacterized protein LOC110441333 [Mizuhopecten yessoensis]
MGRRRISSFRAKPRQCFFCCILVVTFTVGYLMGYSTNSLQKYSTHTDFRNTKLKQVVSNQDTCDKPRLVLGMLTPAIHINYRNAQRSTWLSTIQRLQNELPFKITYKFLVDQSTNETIIENNYYNDLVFLNVTSHGRAVKFGEKLYVWFKYIHEHYPDALLGAKVDDDVFLCVPQIFKRLDQLKSSKLYYGWTHGVGSRVNIDTRIDEMFVVVGKDLLERIAKRKYCTEKKCNANEDLIDTDFGGTSLGAWLSIYDDIDYRSDNKRIIQLGKGKEREILLNIKPGFCSKYVLNHKSSVEVMEQLHEYNKPGSVSLHDGFIGAVTGSLFSGKVVRTFLPQSLTSEHKYLAILDEMPPCDNWAVVTTIFSPSKAVKYIVSLSKWCLVIVADTKTPLQGAYLHGLGMNNETSKRIKYLSLKEQNTLYPLLSETIPVKHFGRKNIGYIYAIHHKAKFIWDFDDDNYGILDIDDFKPDFHLPHVTVCNDAQTQLVNPYPYFGVKETYTWPRGFPLQDIKNKTTLPKLCNSSDSITLGIIQSLANQQPDIDAIYRMTRDAPFDFSATRLSHKPFVLPRNTYTPFNAQATLWLAPAFTYMALPISVNGRVSDIWRSYIAQYYLHRKNVCLAFSSPSVIQERNAHNILRDFNAELDLYQKSKQLVDFLVYERFNDKLDFVEMYKTLYSRQYLEHLDIQFAEAWTKTLENITKSE